MTDSTYQTILNTIEKGGIIDWLFLKRVLRRAEAIEAAARMIEGDCECASIDCPHARLKLALDRPVR